MRKIMTLVNEAIAKPGDWEGGEFIGPMSELVYHLKWTKVGSIVTNNGDVYEIAKHNVEPSFIAGCMAEQDGREIFGMVFQIDLTPIEKTRFSQKSEFLKYENLHIVNGVKVRETDQGKGIAKLIYKWLVDEDILLLGDRIQYFGARRLWAALSRDTDIVVDIIDFDSAYVIDRDVILHHGRYDADFDERVWSYGEDKQHIRLILRKIS